MRYFIKIDSVSAGESGLITEGKKQLLILDVSYHDKCDLTYSEYLNPETLNQIKDVFKSIFKSPFTSDYVARKFYDGKLNSTYEEFMKHATLKKKGKENV